MRPTLLEIGSLKFHAWPAMLAIAFVVGTLLAAREANRGERAFPGTPQGGLWGFVGALVGAKVFWILQFSEPRYLWGALFVWQGGMVYYGGLIGGVAGLALYVTLNRFPYWRTADVCAPYLALGQAITRVGCFLNGCCWGVVAENLPWAVRFPRHSHPFNRQVEEGLLEPSADVSLPTHPTQLYMAAGLLAIALILKVALSRKRPFDGTVALGYCFLYGILRFIVEFYRGDSARSVFGMTVSQAISLVFIVGSTVTFAVVMHRVRLRRPAQALEQEPEEEDA